MLQSYSVGQTQSPTGWVTTDRTEAIWKTTNATLEHRILNAPAWPSRRGPRLGRSERDARVGCPSGRTGSPRGDRAQVLAEDCGLGAPPARSRTARRSAAPCPQR